MRFDVCYVMTNGEVYDCSDMQKAFYISTGKDHLACRSDYLRWLDGLFGVSIKEYFKPTVRRLLDYGDYKIKAIMFYREIHGCTVREAKEYVEKIMAERDERYEDSF